MSPLLQTTLHDPSNIRAKYDIIGTSFCQDVNTLLVYCWNEWEMCQRLAKKDDIIASSFKYYCQMMLMKM